MQVIPEWADQKKETFRELIKNWRGENPDFNAMSDRNKANRGNEGTHSAGSRSADRYQQHMVHIYMEELNLFPFMFPLDTHNIVLRCRLKNAGGLLAR